MNDVINIVIQETVDAVTLVVDEVNDAVAIQVTDTIDNVTLVIQEVGVKGDSASPLTTKGDLYTYDTADQRLAVGANTFVLTADSAEPTGLKWAAGGAGDMVLASAQTNTGIKTFLDATMKLRNVANTFDGYFVNTNTADRIYTLQDTPGTLAFVTRAIVGITGTKSQFDTAVTDGNILYVGDVTSNVSTALSTGTVTATTYGITSDGGADDVVILEATTSLAGVLGSDKWDEIVANSLKNTNVSTDLSMGTVDGTQYNINSSDGNNVSLPLADTNNWGIISDEIFDEIVVNNAKVTNANHTGDVTGSTALTIGAGKVTEAMQILADNTTQDFSTSAHGYVPKGTNVGNFLKDDGTWAAPSGSGDMVLADAQTITGAKTFDAATLLLNDTDSAFDLELGSTSTITGANKTLTFDVNDANRTLTIAADATISNTNTGDETSIVGISGTKAQFSTECSDGTFLYVGDVTSNVSTALSTGTVTATTYGITSDGGADDVVLVEATTSVAGLLGAAKWDEIVANTAKSTNVTTNLSLGALSATTMIVNSSDGTNATLIEADTTNAGLLGSDKWDEIVANTIKTSNIVQTDLTSISDTKANFNSSLTDGSFIFVGDPPTSHTHVLADITDYDESKSITIESPDNTEDISMFFTNKAITVTEMRAVRVGGTTVTWTIRHGTDRNATGAEVVTSGTTTTSNTTGSDVTSFNDATIVADSFVWVETSGTVDVSEFNITIFYTID